MNSATPTPEENLGQEQEHEHEHEHEREAQVALRASLVRRRLLFTLGLVVVSALVFWISSLFPGPLGVGPESRDTPAEGIVLLLAAFILQVSALGFVIATVGIVAVVYFIIGCLVQKGCARVGTVRRVDGWLLLVGALICLPTACWTGWIHGASTGTYKEMQKMVGSGSGSGGR